MTGAALIAKESAPAVHRLYEDAIEANEWKAARRFADELQTRTGVDPTTRIAELFDESDFRAFMVQMLRPHERRLVLGLLKLFREPKNEADLKRARDLLARRGDLSLTEIRRQVRENKASEARGASLRQREC